RRLLLVNFVCGSLFWLVGWYAQRWYTDEVAQAELQRLEGVATALRVPLTLLDHEDSMEQMRWLEDAVRGTDIRVTLVARDGEVYSESEALADAMENHQRRAELVEASRLGTGTSRRVSATLGIPMQYLAVTVQRDGRDWGYLRVSVPLRVQEQRVARFCRRYFILALSLMALASLSSWWGLRQTVVPLRKISLAMHDMAAGKSVDDVDIPWRAELGQLGLAFNRMREKQQSRESHTRHTVDRMSTVLAGMIEGVIAVDPNERILFANRAAGRLLGFVSETAHGKGLLEVARNHMLREAVRVALNSQSQRDHEPQNFEIVAGSKRDRTVSINVACLPGTPSPGVVLVFHDITELRRLEYLRQEFVANVSHELKTPLSAIKAYAETLRSGAVDDPSVNRQFLANIETQSDRLHELIQDMLQLARIESGEQAFDITSIDIGQAVEDCVARYREHAASRSIELAIEADQPELKVRADDEGLRQILDNLVDNAVKYTPMGGRVELSWVAEQGFAVIRVADNGIGISKPDQLRVFERFFRVDKARSRELGSTGLGLAIVKHLAQSFGGSVALASKLREGSEFLVRLPLA
ncbi:MAG: PAS domain-containing protein, partial [Planctomycetales bacterium]|nr:PAS domain-containing protein [Planctomycetales bacterium]